MRKVIDLNGSLRVKATASRIRTNLRRLLEALRSGLRTHDRRRREEIRLPTFRGDGLNPGVSLDKMDDAYDRMDGLR